MNIAAVLLPFLVVAVAVPLLWGEWVGGSMVATLAIPLGAFATSLAYASLTRHP